jgi:hypothetical protein
VGSKTVLLQRRGCVAANPVLLSSFGDYLKVQNKRNIRQLLCYASRYHTVLETGDASPIARLSSGAIRRHVMEALAA